MVVNNNHHPVAHSYLPKVLLSRALWQHHDYYAYSRYSYRTLKIISKQSFIDLIYLFWLSQNNLNKIEHLIVYNDIEFLHITTIKQSFTINLTTFSSLKTIEFCGNFNDLCETEISFKVAKTSKMTAPVSKKI